MFLNRLRLQNFRNYPKKELEFIDGVTIIVGPNTAGKTNILEAIYLLASGRSFKAGLESEMIQYDSQIARAKGRVLGENVTDLEVVLTRGEVGGEKTARKKFLVNGVSKRMGDFVGHLMAVYFRPEDLYLVTSGPSTRRKYLDAVLSQINKEYVRCLLSYEKGLRQRNKLLERIREEGVSRSQLLFWNQLLIKNGSYLIDKREEFIEFVNNISLDYGYSLDYDKSIISVSRLEEYAEEEVAAGATLVGPHRDDFSFRINSNGGEPTKFEFRDLAAYGSRGEQRMGVLRLKMAELGFITQKTNERPILLLDDIFSELDERRRQLVLEIVFKQQTLITNTDLELADKSYKDKVNVIELGEL